MSGSVTIYTRTAASSARGAGVATAILLVLSTGILHRVSAADLEGARDHPVVSRYEGSEIVRYRQDTFNEYTLYTEPVVKSGATAGPAQPALQLEGRVTRITYRSPPERTTLEIFRNYEQALTQGGFEVLFSCRNMECGGYEFNRAITDNTNLIGSYGDQRYLAARLAREQGDIYVALYAAMANVGGGPDYRRVLAQLHLIEVSAMQGDMVTVDAEAMAREIGKQGRIALYGILFDHDSATIRPESRPTLEQIAALLNGDPELSLVIVGHTDNQGSLDYNMGLSRRRALAVRAAMVSEYGIAGDRLEAWGAGYLSPVASNRTEDGRARNRRVELVEQ